MNEPVGIKIELEQDSDAKVPVGSEIAVRIALRAIGHSINDVREILFDFRASKGVKVLHFHWNRHPYMKSHYHLDGSVKAGVIRANATRSRRLLTIFSYDPVLICTVFLKVRRTGEFSVVGKPITKRRPYHRDSGFRVGAGFGSKDKVWNFDPKRESVIEHEPLKIEVG